MDIGIHSTRGDRHARIIRAKFVLKGGTRGDMLVQNISDRGVGARCDLPGMMPGDEIELELPVLGMVAGIIRWVSGGRMGVMFREAIDVDRVRFHQQGALMCSPEKFSVAHRFQPTQRTYRPGLRTR